MLFNSLNFMLFYPIVLLVYYILPAKVRYVWLLAASYYFYMGWNPKYALLIALSTLITYLSGLWIEKRSHNHRMQKVILVSNLAANLGILFFFKYFDFALENINMVRSRLGAGLIDRSVDVVLPVGISFYTFQALSYTMDVYKGTIRAERNVLKYALFVSFFPQLVAGPIERSESLLHQIKGLATMKGFDYGKMVDGVILILWGLFQKMVIADRAAILVDTVYDSYWLYGSVELILASILFAVQIYCDFGSYSIIAVGTAKILGIELMENFNTPYFAQSIKGFWRRWHISLSSWFRDYVYIPLGGGYGRSVIKCRNLMITFLLSGLWHGASWNYVIWGGIHGLYQIVGNLTIPYRRNIKERFAVKDNSISYKMGKAAVTFVLVDFAWIFFRADSLSDAKGIVEGIFTRWNPWKLFDQSVYHLGLDVREIHILTAAVVLLFLVDLIRYGKDQMIHCFLQEQCIWFRWGMMFVLFFSILIFGAYGPAFDAKQFIYFQF